MWRHSQATTHQRSRSEVTIKLVTSNKDFRVKSFWSLQAKMVGPLSRIHKAQNSKNLTAPQLPPDREGLISLAPSTEPFHTGAAGFPSNCFTFCWGEWIFQSESYGERTRSKTTSSDSVAFSHHSRMLLQIKEEKKEGKEQAAAEYTQTSISRIMWVLLVSIWWFKFDEKNICLRVFP